MILLDTHTLIWLTEDSPRLGTNARRAADDALANGALAVSAISFWELAMLRRKGRIGMHQPVEAWRRRLLDMGLGEIAVDGSIAVAAAELADFHEDPADRIILATASGLGGTLITADARMQDWDGGLRVQDARQ